MKSSAWSIKLNSSTASVGLLLLFPGFYFYHWSLATALIPPFLGGFFSPVALILLCLFLFGAQGNIRRISSVPVFTSIFLALEIWCILMAVFSLIFNPAAYRWEAFGQVVQCVFLWTVLFLVGVNLDIENRGVIRKLFWISGLIIAGSLVIYVIRTGSVFFYAKAHDNFSPKVASYQGFARSAFVVAFFCYANKWVRGWRVPFVVILSVFSLFVLGARSQFVAYGFTVAMYILFRWRRERSQILVPLVGGIAVAFVLAFYSDTVLSSRQLHVLDFSKDQSWQERMTLGSAAFNRILEHPLIGRVGGHFKSGGIGDYAHNILSAWDAFGAVGFLAYLSLLVWVAWDALMLALKRKSLSHTESLYFCISISVFLLAFTAKSVYSPLPALAWGLMINVRRAGAERLR